MQARHFLLGLALGALSAAAAAYVFVNGGGQPTHGGNDGSGRAPASGVTDGSLQAEIERLRALLDTERAQRARRPVDDAVHDTPTGAVEAAAAESAAVTSASPDWRSAELLRELRDLFESGALERRFADNPYALSEFLVTSWLESGNPARAFGLIQRLDMGAEMGEWGQWIGQSLEDSGDPTMAVEAYTMALRAAPDDWEAILALARLDPEAGLAEHARLMAQMGTAPDDASAAVARAMLLLSTGDRDAALQLLDMHLADTWVPDAFWEKLLELDPTAAEERLRTQIAASDEQGGGTASRLRLATALARQGRSEEARAEIDALLALDPHDSATIHALGELDPDAAMAHLEQLTRTAPTGSAWASYGDRLLAAGRTQEGIEALHEAWRLAPGDGYHARLLAVDPHRIAPELLRIAAETEDDEMYGDVADALWVAGRRDEARGYWQRALEIDRTDSEWINKLRAIADGRDPLQ